MIENTVTVDEKCLKNSKNNLEVISKDKEVILFKIPDYKEIIEKYNNLQDLYINEYTSLSNFIKESVTDGLKTNELLSMELINNNSIDLVLGVYNKLTDNNTPKNTLLYHIRVKNHDNSTQYLINTNIIDSVDTIILGGEYNV